MTESGFDLVPFASTPSKFERVPFLAKRLERKRAERGEDPLTMAVISKIMKDMVSHGFTITYGIDREILAGDPMNSMQHVADTSSKQQHQKMRLIGPDGKMYRAKIRSLQAKEDALISRNELSVSFQDFIPLKGEQRFVAVERFQDFPSFFQEKFEEKQLRHFYGWNIRNGKIDYTRALHFSEASYPVFLQEILESSVDVEATKNEFDEVQREFKKQESARSGAMLSAIWNNPSPAGLL